MSQLMSSSGIGSGRPTINARGAPRLDEERAVVPGFRALRTPRTGYGSTDTFDGSSSAPGPGSPVVMMSVEVVVPGWPVRVMLPCS